MINRGCNGEAFKYHWLRVKTIKEASRDFSWESTTFLPAFETARRERARAMFSRVPYSTEEKIDESQERGVNAA